MIIIFVFGLILGSFLNVCIYRIPQGQSIVFPPSSCRNCGARLAPGDLVPVVSFLILRGKCRYCGNPISTRYPIIESLTACLFTIAWYEFGLSTALLRALLFIATLIVISFIDLDHYIIPDKILFFFIVAWVAFIPFIPINYINSLIGLVSAGGLLLFIALLSKGGMGGGDIKLAAVIGLYLGWPNALLAMFLACFLAGIVGILLILLKIKSRKDIIPFGPFIAAASYITLLWGEQILNWYMSLF
ncbi:prepilin peptidase [Desulfotomaculum nigrificans]|uniref:prepilin peptidase n=1 Tax=Desulfotomaculum nigrificans TaxID=1565 RepID=UPI0001FAE7DF|nr:A24 family peptidase [Desulfotomaculum nigrificans]